MGILKRTLALGVTKRLAHMGGWQKQKFKVGDRIVEGRTWERHPNLELRFSRFTMRLLRWMTASPMNNAECPVLKSTPNTIADHLMLYLSVDLLDRLNCGEITRQKASRSSPLIWLGFANLFVSQDEAESLDFGPWVEGQGAALIEALSEDLADRWRRMEWRKQRIFSGRQMRVLGGAQTATLAAFMDAAAKAGRYDLGYFLIEAAAAVLASAQDARQFAGRLESRGTMRERSEARRAAGAFLKSIQRLGRWAEDAATVRFFDDEYEGAQLFLSRFERISEKGMQHADRIIKNLEALDSAAIQDQPGEQA